MKNKLTKAWRHGWFNRIMRAAAGLGLLSIALSCAAAGFSQVLVFGDSTVDSGYYKALPNPGGNSSYNAYWPAAVAAGAGAPTTSPGQVYPQMLAAYYGLTANPANQAGGTNFATSGAKNVDANTSANGGFKSAIPTVTQISNYLAASGNHADPNALYLVSSGGNDIAFAAGQSGNGPFPPDPAAYVASRATSLAISIAALKAAGARTILVALLPASFPQNDAAQQQLKAAYNQALQLGLSGLGVNAILADINSVRLAIVNNPAQYGLSYVTNATGNTACSIPSGVTNSWALLCSSNPSAPSTLVAPNADTTRLFADDSHYTTAGQRIIADYLYLLLLQNAFQNYSDSWWNANESGWGLTITDHGANAFLQWYTYDQSGHNQKYVVSGGVFSSDKCHFNGSVTHVTGPSWTLASFDPSQVSRTGAGTAALDFCPSGLPAGTIVFSYAVDGVSASKQLTRLSFGNDVPHQGGLANTGGPDFTDLWWNPAESGWGVSVTQHGNNLFFRIFVYDTDNRPLLFVVPGVTAASPTSFSGALQLTTGPYFGSAAFDPSQVVRTTAGTASLNFTDAGNGVLTYTVNGVTKTRSITRLAF